MTEFIITCPSELDADGHYRIDRWKELIRCKDCKHGSIYCTEDTNGETLYECNIHGIAEIEVHRFDWFCADGRKRDDT